MLVSHVLIGEAGCSLKHSVIQAKAGGDCYPATVTCLCNKCLITTYIQILCVYWQILYIYYIYITMFYLFYMYKYSLCKFKKKKKKEVEKQFE